MKKFFLIIVLSISVFASCNKFTLHINSPLPLKVVLARLFSKCNLTLIPVDKESKKVISTYKVDLINVKNATLNQLLDTIFNTTPLFYKIKDNKVFVSFYKNAIFKIDFIPNVFSGYVNMDSFDNSIKSAYKRDFWSELKENLIQILKNEGDRYKEPVIDKSSSLVSVTGNKNQLLAVKEYIDNLLKRLKREVLIDVRIYSVELSKSHQSGIDWSKLSLSLPDSSVPLRGRYIGGSEAIFNAATFNASAFLNFLAQNGNVNSISNPKIVTLNNQKSIISIGETIYYKYASKVVTDNNGNPSTEYTIGSKFVGVLLDITPQISDNGEIILSINPKISAFKDQTQITSQRDMPPDTKENTLITTIRLKNNETLVIGGLIADDKTLKVNGVPILKEIPIIKYLFSSQEEVSSKRELVFVITPHIIDLDKKTSLKKFLDKR
jgi:general secretion pathway protein D